MPDHNRSFRFRSPVVKVTGAKTHHFFAADPQRLLSGGDAFLMVDADRGVAVYTDRARCLADAEAMFPDLFITVVGMGDEKWALFQSEVPHHLVQ